MYKSLVIKHVASYFIALYICVLCFRASSLCIATFFCTIINLNKTGLELTIKYSTAKKKCERRELKRPPQAKMFFKFAPRISRFRGNLKHVYNGFRDVFSYKHTLNNNKKNKNEVFSMGFVISTCKK